MEIEERSDAENEWMEDDQFVEVIDSDNEKGVN